jgi:hypothetical protein
MGFSPEELYQMRRTVTDLGRELNIASNDISAAAKSETAQAASSRLEPD